MALAYDRNRIDFATYKPQHFLWSLDGKVATITLNRPERKNPLTFESYAELRDTFRALAYADQVKTVVVVGAGGNFCSGGDVHEIIGPLVRMQEAGDMLDHALHRWNRLQELGHRCVKAGQRPQWRLPMGIRQASHVEHKIGIRRHAVFEAEGFEQ